jgi:hypothetical protein
MPASRSRRSSFDRGMPAWLQTEPVVTTGIGRPLPSNR